jgi:hypothetical protein
MLEYKLGNAIFQRSRACDLFFRLWLGIIDETARIYRGNLGSA